MPIKRWVSPEAAELVAEHLKSCAFVNRRLTVHPAADISLRAIERLYHLPRPA